MTTDRKILHAALRSDFELFARKCFASLYNDNELSKDPYITVVCDALEEVSEQKCKRLILNMPPRHAKTFLASTALSAWELAHHPSHHVMIISYGENLAVDIAYNVRRILREKWFLKTFACRIADDRSAASDFKTTDGGGLFATSIGGAVTGRGADLIVEDDPNKIEDAGSPLELERVHRIHDTTIVSRLNNASRGRMVVVSQRIAATDLTGHLLAQGGWKHLALPLVAEKAQTYFHRKGAWKRKRGEVLRRDSDTPRVIKSWRAACRVPDFDTLYQQAPARRQFQITDADFPRYVARPANYTGIVLSIDTAQREGRGHSFSVIQAWTRVGNEHFLVDQWRDQASFETLRNNVRAFYARHAPAVILVEDTGVGSALISEIEKRKRGSGLRVVGITPGTASKAERLQRVAKIVKAGCVKLPQKKEYAVSLLEEFESFPNGDSTDQVDALTQYLGWASTNPAPSRHQGDCGGVIGNTRGFTILFYAGHPHRPATSFASQWPTNSISPWWTRRW